MDLITPEAAIIHAAEHAIPGRPTSLLRFLTCGSVDDGKSTLIGRLLHDAGQVKTDQLDSLHKDSRKYGTDGEKLDFALLVDGLSAEREQGITIDVAYRYFATPRRAFIVADTPGHEQYTRNMATGASSADVAVILVDARKGILPQTRRHSFIAAMMRVRHVVLAVNKMDTVGFERGVFEELVADYRRAVDRLGFASVRAIPLCAREGDNLVTRSDRMPWYVGPTLLAYLETIAIERPDAGNVPLRLPVQWVSRPDAGFRGYAGTIARGTIRPGERVRVLPAGRIGTVARIVTADGDLAEAVAEQAVTLTLREELDISRGDVLVGEADSIAARQEFTARILWMDEAPLRPEAEYELRIGTATATARVARLHHAIDIHSYAPVMAEGLSANAIGLVTLTLDRKLAIAAYEQDRELGGFILVDRISNATAALGMVVADAPSAVVAPRVRRWSGISQAASWRILGSATTFGLVWLVSGRLALAAAVVAAELPLKAGLAWLHGKLWAGRAGPAR